MKVKKHRFTLVVKTTGRRVDAENAVLFAFAKRSPDACEFNLIRKAPKK